MVEHPETVFHRLRDEQRSRWLAGDRVPAETLLTCLPGGATDPDLLLDLIYSEFCLREELGESPDPEEYCRRYPEHASELTRLFELHQAMDDQLPANEEATPGASPSELTAVDLSSKDDTLLWDNSSAGTPSAIMELGDYVLLEEIGRGGMGIVYRARQRSLNRIVALKVMTSGEFASLDDVRRFHVEAEAAASLRHPGIVPVFSVGEHSGRHYFAMEFVEGTDLESLIREQTLPVARAAELLRDVALAVEHAHEAGVLHRDLKPSNILLDHRQQPRVTDFGLARRIDTDSSLTATGQILGTPGYMPPEQADGRSDHCDHTADIYALGGVLYSVLTGRPPHRGGSALETLRLVLEQEPVSPRLIDPGIPRDLETICLKCLDKDPVRRYQSAGELAEELDRFLRGEPILARPISRPARLWRWCRRNPVVASLLALASVLGLVLAVGGPLAAVQQSKLRRDAEDQRHQAEKQRREAVEEKKRAEGLLYAAQISRAQDYLNEDDFGGMRDSLNACRCDLRGWEHNYLSTLPKSTPLTLNGHEDLVRGVSFTSDGRHIVSGSNDKTVRVWDVESGECLRKLTGHGGIVRCVDISADDALIVSGGDDGNLMVWDLKTGNRVRTMSGHTDAVTSVCYSPFGRMVVSGGEDGTVRFWDSRRGLLLRTLKEHPVCVRCVAFDSTGMRIVSGSDDGTLKIWSLRESRTLLTLHEHHGPVTCAAFSPDGTKLVSSGGDGTVIVWEASSGKLLHKLEGHDDQVWTVAFSPDGSRIASGSGDSTLRVWDSALGQSLVTLSDHTNHVTSVAFSPDGGRIVSGSFDHTIKVWNGSERQEPLVIVAHDHGINSVDYSSDSRHFVSASHDQTVKIWNLRTCQPVMLLDGHTAPVITVSYSPDGRRLASGDFGGTITLWNCTTGEVEWTHQLEGERILSVAFSPDGELLAGALGTGTLRLWRVDTGNHVGTLAGHEKAVTSVCFTPDGQRLISGSEDRTVRIWDVETQNEVDRLVGHRTEVMSVAVSSDGKLLVSGGNNGTIRFWDPGSGTSTEIRRAHQDSVRSLCFNRDASRLVSAGADRVISVWNVASAQKTLTLKGHGGSVKTVRFSPDARQIVSGGDDHRLRFWTVGRWLTDSTRTANGDEK